MASSMMSTEEKLTTQPETSIVDNLINLLPFEVHAPGYHFCGPGTKLNDRLKRKERGVNPLDDYCREHDIAYSYNGDRSKADRLLAKRAFARLLSETATTNEKSVALVTTCCMISKITFDKFSSFIKRTVKRNVKKRIKKFIKNKKNGKSTE